MNLRLMACVLMGVFTTYMGLAMLIGHFRSKPASEPPSKPNFSARSEQVVDERSGEKTIYREITVSTKLSGPVQPEGAKAPSALSAERPSSVITFQTAPSLPPP